MLEGRTVNPGKSRFLLALLANCLDWAKSLLPVSGQCMTRLPTGTPGAIRTGLLALPAGVCNSHEYLAPTLPQDQLLQEPVTTESHMGWCPSAGHNPRC